MVKDSSGTITSKIGRYYMEPKNINLLKMLLCKSNKQPLTQTSWIFIQILVMLIYMDLQLLLRKKVKFIVKKDFTIPKMKLDIF